MNKSAIFHRNDLNNIYALDKDTLRIILRTGKDVKSATLFANDPYINGISSNAPWYGKAYQMKVLYELSDNYLFYADINPDYKRLQYYFEISDDNQSVIYLEDGCHEKDFITDRFIKHYFKYGFINEADIMTVPISAKETLWYQIFPDRFSKKDCDFSKEWIEGYYDNSMKSFNGNLKGITDKLSYICDLGINGIYLNPVFMSKSNHKYDVDDYKKVSEDFGSSEDLKELVNKAHSLGIKVMFDAVFNHSGLGFFAWQDVMKNGTKSPYYDWYFINGDVNDENFFKDHNTRDSRYYSFAYVHNLPKLNTSKKDVQDYFIDILKYWIDEFNIDAIRFDVGNEISHEFIKRIRSELKGHKEDLFLLGEIWMDSGSYLRGDEYDSVMNYPLNQKLITFFEDEKQTADDFMYGVNYCLSLYQKQCNEVMFNLLSSHDVDRITTRIKSKQKALELYAILLTMPGAPCVYYGDELLLDAPSRGTMPWNELLNNKEMTNSLYLMKKLMEIRSSYKELSNEKVSFIKSNKRLLHYLRPLLNGTLEVFVNEDKTDEMIVTSQESRILFESRYENGILKSGGILIILKN